MDGKTTDQKLIGSFANTKSSLCSIDLASIGAKSTGYHILVEFVPYALKNILGISNILRIQD